MSAIRHAHSLSTLVAFAFALGLSGCGQQSAAPPPAHAAFPPASRVITPIDVTRIDLGTAVKPDGSISQPTTVFKPSDTIMAAVTTERPGHDIKLTARWIFAENNIAKESTQTISPANILVTDFQATNGSGWPVGRYKLDMFVNGTLAAVTSFEVKN